MLVLRGVFYVTNQEGSWKICLASITGMLLNILYKHPFRQLLSAPLAIETPTPAKYSSNLERSERQKIEDSEEN